MNPHFKVVILVILLGGVSESSLSQTYVASYAEKRIIDSTELKSLPKEIKEHKLSLSNSPNLYTLTYSNGVSMYSENAKTQNSKYYYKNISSETMLFQLLVGSEKISGKDQLLDMNWKLTDETIVINGFECKKAISNWNNYFFVAWYADAVAINAGPERFNGLPGLIVKVAFGSSEIILEGLSIYKDNLEIAVPVQSSSTKTILEVDQYIKGKIAGYEKIGTSTLIKRF